MHPSPDPLDQDLVQACRDPNNDRFDAAFEALYRRYRDRVYAIAYRVTGNTVDALDAAQESFATLFRKIAGFREDSAFSTWLFRLVVNCSIDLVRSRTARRRTLSLETVDEIGEPATEGVDPPSAAARGELGELVHRGLQQLSPKLRAALALRYLEGMSYEELGVTLEVSIGTVKSRLARAHVALEGVLRSDPVLRDYFGEGEEVA